MIDLYKWLCKLNLQQHYEAFVTEELYLDVLGLFDEAVLDQLLTKLNIMNRKEDILKACDELKNDLVKKGFEEGIRKASKKKEIAKMEALTPDELQQLKLNLEKRTGESSDKRFYWLISPSDLQFIKELGSGAFATVYKGTFRGKTVAIKVLNPQQNETFLEEFVKEFQVMRFGSYKKFFFSF